MSIQPHCWFVAIGLEVRFDSSLLSRTVGGLFDETTGHTYANKPAAKNKQAASPLLKTRGHIFFVCKHQVSVHWRPCLLITLLVRTKIGLSRACKLYLVGNDALNWLFVWVVGEGRSRVPRRLASSQCDNAILLRLPICVLLLFLLCAYIVLSALTDTLFIEY